MTNPSKLRPCIAIDWLQCTVKMPRKDYENLFRSKNQVVKIESDQLKKLDEKYQLEKTGIQTRNFACIYEVKDRKTGEDIAVIAAQPRSLMCMQEDTALIKIINKFLYQKNFSDFVRELFTDLQLKFLNITRLDICYDFERFDTMECYDFIRRVMQERYIKTLCTKFKAMGDCVSIEGGKKTGGVDSLKFGKETSDVSYYLYNKTKELQQVKNKPWIHEHWRSNGWKGDTEVFRLEFSLRPDTRGIPVVDAEGEVSEILHFKDLSMLDHIQEVFEFHFNKYFQFVRAERTQKGNWKKQSRCKKVVLFKTLTFESVKIELSNKKDSGRADKVFAKKLKQFNDEMRGTDFDLSIFGKEMLTWVIVQRGLQSWAEKKMPDMEYSDRIVDIFSNSRNGALQLEIMRNRDKSANVYKTAQEQTNELINLENHRRAVKFEIAPENKVACYNSDGKLVDYIDSPF
jgi:hypothetical protein